jgi:hypothetical protein
MYFGATITDDGVIDWSPDIPAPALVEMHPDIQPAKGIPEPFVGREWRGADGAGLYVSTPVFCWQPGAKFNEGRQFTIGDYGVWRIAR